MNCNRAHYKHADRYDLSPIPWKSDAEKEAFKAFVLKQLQNNGPTHVDSLIAGHFETEYLSPMYMGRLGPVLLALEEMRLAGKVLIDESEYVPVRLPNQLRGASA